MEAKTPDLIAMILKKFDLLGDEMHRLGTSITQLSVESSNVVKMLVRLETAVEKLEARDDAQQKALDDLRLDLHRTDSGLTAVSNTANQAFTLAQQHEGIAQTSIAERAQLRKDVDRHTVQLCDFERVLETHVNQWEPWLRVIKWALVIIGGVVATALAIWLLRDVATSVIGNSLP